MVFIDTYIYVYIKHDVSLIQGVKRKMPRAFMVWPRLIREHVPFFLTHETPLEFNQMLFTQLFQSMGRQLIFTEDATKRRQLKQRLFYDLKDIEIPLYIRLYLSLLTIFPFDILRKIYGYYLVPYVVRNIVKKNSIQ